MEDESLDDLKKRLELISKIRQQVNLIHNVYENKRILGKSNFQKTHSVKKGESSRDLIVLGNGMDYIPPIDSLKKQHRLSRRAHNIIQDYDNRTLPSVIRKPFDFFPYNKYDFVGKRQPFVRTATGQSTAIVPYAPSLEAELSAKYGMHGPEIPNPNDRAAEKEKERRENRYRYNRLQATRHIEQKKYIYESAPWMKSLIQSGKLDKKYLPLISKGINKLHTMPGGGAILRAAKNPYIATAAAVIGVLKTLTALRIGSEESKSELQSISDLSTFGRNSNYTAMAMGLGMNEKQAVQSWQRLQGRYGPATEQVLLSFGRAAKGKPGKEVQQMAQVMGMSLDDANIALMLTGGKEITESHGFNLAKAVKDRARLNTRSKGVMGVAEDWIAEKLFLNDAKTVDAIDSMTQRLRDKVERTESEASSQSAGGSYSGSSVTNDNRVTNIDPEINITINGNADPKEVAAAVEDGMNRAISRQEVLDTVSRGIVA